MHRLVTLIFFFLRFLLDGAIWIWPLIIIIIIHYSSPLQPLLYPPLFFYPSLVLFFISLVFPFNHL